MKKLYFILSLLLTISFAAFAQPANDNCNTATNLGSLPNPGTCTGGLQNGAAVSANGTITGATAANPYTYIGSGCSGSASTMASPANDVWYSFTATGTTVNINISGGVANPNIALYTGNCGNLAGRGCAVGTNAGAGTLTLTQMTIGQTYYIQVSGNSPTATGNFTISVDNDIDCNDCLRVSTLTATPAPVNGAYQPGQSVQFCYSITEWSQQNTNWIHGVQISFGSGWSGISGINAPSPVCNTGTWSYFPTGIGNVNGTSWGPGFYFDTGDAGTSPANNFGDGGLNCNPDNNDPLTFCWTLTVPSTCNPGANLSVTVNTSGDGESGGWTSTGCNDDAATNFVASIACCLPTVSSTPVTCPGGTNGTATATPGSTSSPYDYSWTGPNGYTSSTSNLNGAQTISNLAAGTYTVTVTDNNNCSKTTTVVVTTTNTAPTANAGADISICSGATGNLGTSTTAGYSYVWTPATGLSNSTISNPTVTLTNGGSTNITSTYTVTVTGPGGCTATDVVVVTVKPVPVASFAPVTNQCLTGNSFNFSNTTSPTPTGTSYSWTFASGSPATSTSTNPSGVTWSAAGTYAVNLTAVAAGCTTTYSQNITIYPMPVVTTSTTPVLCNGGTTGTATATGGGTYSWNTTPSQSTPTASGLAAGTYTVTVTSANGCRTTQTAIVTQPPVLAATQSQVNVLCNGASTGSATVSPTGGTGAYTYSWSNGATTATASNLAAGSYSVVITDANGCQITRTFTITQPALLVPTTSAVNATCGASNGSVSVSVTGGTGAYTYSWNTTPAQTTATASNLPAGTYTVTVRDVNGCIRTATATISNTAGPVPVASGTNILCFGASTGTATVSVSGGTTPYTYSWSNGATTQTINSLAAGTYTVTVTAANGCPGTSSVVLTQPAAALSSTQSQQNVTCNGLTNGSATVSVTGGTTGYTYSWNTSPAQTTATASNLGAGSYNVTITDANGCQIVRPFTITQPTAMTVSTSSTNATCGASNGTATVSASGGTGALTYSWNTTPVQTGATATGLAAGAYNVTVTDANGCSQPATVSVNNNASPTATMGAPTHVSCFGGTNGSATVSATGGTGAYTYSWSNGSITATASNLAAGTYSVTVTDAAGCSASSSVVITQPSALTATSSGVNPTCFGGTNGTATVSPAGGTTAYTYSWNTTPSQSTVTATGLTQGTYNVVVTDSKGCTVNSTVTLTQPTAVAPTATGSPVSCFGLSDGSANASATGGTGSYSYSWAPTGGTAAIATGLVAGTYTVSVTDGNGCLGTTTAIVTQPAALTTTTSSTPASCNGSSDGTVTATPAGGTPNYTYSWSSGTSQTVSGLPAGTYPVTITDANGCTVNSSATVTQPSAILLTSTNGTVFCGQANGSVSVNATGGTGAFTYSWNTAPSQTTATATGVGTGTYSVTVTDANGCTANSTASVSNNTGGTASATSVNVSCFGGSNGSATASMSGGTAPFTYTWSTSPAQYNATANNLTAGSYTVTITDNNGCSGTATVGITEPAQVTASTTTVAANCNGSATGSATVSASGGTGAFTYSWNTTPSQTGATASNIAAGTYSVSVTDANGCTISTSAIVTEPTAIVLSTTTVSENCVAGNGSATVTATGGTPGAGYSYSWSTTPSQSNATASSLSQGTYTVAVTDANGCIAQTSATVGTIPGGTAAISTFDVSCNGDNDGSATVSMSGAATAPYTYSWSNSQTTATAVNLIAGNYSVTVTDSFGCVATASGTVNQPATLLASVLQTNVTCNGGTNGAASVSATGGTAPYTYSWSNGPTTSNISNVPAGPYSVIVTDNNGCVKSASFTITEPTAIVVTETSHTDATCNQSNGASTASASGGQGTFFTYNWTPGPYSGASVSNLPANTYIVTATDASGCTAMLPVTIQNLSGPAITLTSTDVSCFGGNDGTASVTATGGALPYSYSWNTSPAQLNPSATNLTAGNYTVVVSDNTGCVASTSVQINEPSDIVINLSKTDPLCFGACNGTASATVTGGTTPYTYSWSAGSTTPAVSGLCAGTYTLVVTDANGCVKSGSIVLANPVMLTASTTVVNASCQGVCDGSATVTTMNGTTPYTYSWTGGQSTPTASQLCAGTYTISVTDANNCVVQSTAVITQPASLTVSIGSSGNVSCYAGADGFANAIVSGGTTPYTYSWTPGGYITPNPSGMIAGSYTVTVTDNKGCTANAIVSITQPTPLIATTTKVDATCFNACNGSATASVSGGTGPYTYLWTPGGQSNATANNLCAGTYNVNITDAEGCTVVNSVVINQPSLLAVTTNAVSSNCQQNNGYACANVAGGIPPYSYQWNDPNNQTSSCAVNLYATSYMVTVTDGNGCIVQSPANINDIQGPTASIVASTNITCYGDSNGTALANISGGVAPYVISWTPTGPTSTFANNLAQGWHSITVTDTAGCVGSASVFISQPAAITAWITSVNPSCFASCDGSATVNASGGTGTLSFFWNSIPSQNTQTATNLCAGTYTVTVTDSNNCSAQFNRTLTQPQPLVLGTATISNVSCNDGTDGSIIVYPSGGTPAYNIQWAPNVGTGTQLTGLSAGAYTATLIDAKGCTVNQTYNVTEPLPLVVNTTVNPATCGNGNGYVTAQATGGTSPYVYLWNDPMSQANDTASNLYAGSYVVVATDLNGCTDTATAVLNNIPGPAIDSVRTVDVTCYNTNTGSATVFPSGGTLPYTYSWSPITQTTNTVTSLQAGSYAVTVTDANGCKATNSLIISQPPLLTVVETADDTICYGQTPGMSLYANASGGTPAYTYSWSNGYAAAGPNVVSPSTGTSYYILVTDNNGCIVRDTINVAVRAPLFVSATDQTICAGDSAQVLSATTGGTGAYTYTWSPSVSTTAGFTTTPASTTTYTLTVNDGCSTPASTSVQVIVNPRPFVVLNPVANECMPADISFGVTTDIGSTYSWNIPGSGTSNLSNPIFQFGSAGVYDVNVTVTSGAGCPTTVTAPGFVTIYQKPNAVATADPASTTTLNPTVTFTDMSTDASSWNWNFGDEDTSLAQNPVHTYQDTGSYTTQLIVISPNGCRDTTTLLIQVSPDFAIYVPSAFSPNGDGVNEKFFAYGIGINPDKFEMRIFDRWGNMLFRSTRLDQGWDGKANGGASVAQEDVYIWLISAEGIEGTPYEGRGTVSIVK